MPTPMLSIHITNLLKVVSIIFIKLMNLQTEYVEEHAANAGTLDLLEVETSERIRLERELNELRVNTRPPK